MKRIVAMGLCTLLSLVGTDSLPAETRTVRLPLTLEYGFVRSLLVQQVFNGPGERILLTDDEGCAQTELSRPEVGSEAGLLRIGAEIRIRPGVVVMGKCIHPVKWEGYVDVLASITLRPSDWRVELTPERCLFYSSERKQTVLSGAVQKLASENVKASLGRLSIDLLPYLQNLRVLLPLFFPETDRKRVEAWLGTVRPGGIEIGREAVRMEVLMDVEPVATVPGERTAELSSRELADLEAGWETWDGYLVYQIESLVGEPLSPEEQDSLLETLLEIRYGFLRAVTERKMSKDVIREQFRWSWKRLASILRKHLTGRPSPNLLTCFAFMNASDAVAALNALGPALGMEMSREGLLHLARMLSTQEVAPSLEYSYTQDPALRKVLGLGPPPEATGPDFDAEEVELGDEPPADEVQPPQSFWHGLLTARAFAAEPKPTGAAGLSEWIVHSRDVGPYLNRVKRVLEEAADETMKKTPIDKARRPFFHLMTLATAWQETCWRQFVKSGGKVRYILSYNNSSIGIMQINDRVWRGVYSIQSLRWDIRYNAGAGCQILHLYLTRYVLKKPGGAGRMNSDTLAGCLYAMYNGGPGEFNKFLERKKKGALYKSDKLFFHRFSLTREGKFEEVATCLTGKR